MLSKIHSFSLHGITGFDIEIEVDISRGIPAFEIVGLADMAVRESKERVRAAIRNTGFEFPLRRVTVNLAPAFVRKEGSSFDLPIAVGILHATGQVQIPERGRIGFLGELSLDGALKPVNGVLPMALRARASGFAELVVPFENALEAAVVEGLDVFPVRGLAELALHLNGERRVPRADVDTRGLLTAERSTLFDFSDVKGQEKAKRALEIAASGGHHCMMIGPPGSGKTMLAKRLPSILPSLTYDESVEITMIHSVAGTLPPGVSLVSTRPFRNPLSNASAASLSGGGKLPKPGEISLAHNGVLFLDELPEFGLHVLDALRQPLEDGCVTVSRVNSKVTYPARTTFICAANPCKCGYYRDSRRACTCTPTEIKNYFGRISGPLLDRIDIQIEVRLPEYSAFYQGGGASEGSDAIRERVENTRRVQKERYAGMKIYSNAQLEGRLIERFCALDGGSREMLRQAYEKLALSARAHGRILKVARTIADMEGSDAIREDHIAEAIGYRSFDRGDWYTA
ncbi:MAG: YifB family Mg chelatase-like AAA ATPase [Clostridiales bacterium]|jgi:magnesium chelatase family protein|nr:YifB family Mg chelatase-like AAA ATPase [Clostridiales bacterium]